MRETEVELGAVKKVKWRRKSGAASNLHRHTLPFAWLFCVSNDRAR
jgi:hypothetical protein